MSNWKSRITGEGVEDPEQLLANPENYRRHPAEQLSALEGALDEIGWIQRVIVNQRTGHMVDGHARVELAIRRGEKEVPVLYVDLDEREEKIALATLDPISGLAYHDEEALEELLKSIETENEALAEFLDDMGGTADEAKEMDEQEARARLSDQYVAPPFSVLDARQKYWRDRKQAWVALGIRSELGRGQDGDKSEGGLVYSVSAQPPHVADRKRELEERDGVTYTWAEFAEKYPEEIVLAGDSIFDPVLAEIAYRWFAPPGGTILDPFAGGSVRGVVASMLGYKYTGLELRAEQVEANRRNWQEIASAGGCMIDGEQQEDSQPELTPVEKRGDYWVKRDDLFRVAGSRGGKVRACLELAKGATGLVTAGSRQSPQVNIVANIARHLGIPARVHVPAGALTPELRAAQAAGAEIVQHSSGYNSVIKKRAKEDAESTGYREIPFGMESDLAVELTAKQVENLPWGEFDRIVIPVGSGINLAGLLRGMKNAGQDVPVVGVRVGADPTKTLDRFAPKDWRQRVKIIKSKQDYHDRAPETKFEGIRLDPIYEAKCLPYLKPGDLFWVVGIRQTEAADYAKPGDPQWICTDSRKMDEVLQAGEKYDLIFSCPPYADLEVYSDDPSDISAMEYDDFLDAYREIIAKAVERLKDNRFAVFVVGDVRDKRGYYRNFVGDTVQAFEDAGARYYNEGILVTSTGSLALRAGNMMRASRKLGKAHQNVMIFAKGQPEKNPIKGLASFLAGEFEEHRKLLEAHEKVLVFAKGDPKAAADEFGPVATQDEDLG